MFARKLDNDGRSTIPVGRRVEREATGMDYGPARVLFPGGQITNLGNLGVVEARVLPEGAFQVTQIENEIARKRRLSQGRRPGRRPTGMSPSLHRRLVRLGIV